jgi:hypothetical protein
VRSRAVGLDPKIVAGYRELRTQVVIKGDGTEEQFRRIHERVLATSPNFHNITRAIKVAPTLIISNVTEFPTTRNHCVTCGIQIPTLSCRAARLGRRRRRA